MRKNKATVIGDGGWGTALALVLHRNARPVTVWGPFPDYLGEIAATRENPRYLPGIPLPGDLTWTSDREAAVRDASLVVLAVPSKFYRAVCERFRGFLPPHAILVSVTKGLCPQSLRRMSELAAEILDHKPIVTLSGPSHAEEVAREIPTAVVAASEDLAAAETVQRIFSDARFRVYTSTDPTGVELGGALKNIIALAVGISDGLGFGDNTRAALITRGLAEITRLGCALGARPETFAGLSGMGDLIVTCTSRHSRNRAVGERLGRGEPIARIMEGMQMVAEGVSNGPAALALARKLSVEAPILEQVQAVIAGAIAPIDAVGALMEREMKPER